MFSSNVGPDPSSRAAFRLVNDLILLASFMCDIMKQHIYISKKLEHIWKEAFIHCF
jgi:hypothetical protein